MIKRWIKVSELPFYQQKGRCWYCGQIVKGSRRHWCSSVCVHEYRIRAHSSYVRWKIRVRDKGVCQRCKVDTKRIETIILEINKTSPNRANKICHTLGVRIAYKKRWRRYVIHGLWDVDHIVPVQYGGGGCGLDNLQTLCKKCHHLKTVWRFGYLTGKTLKWLYDWEYTYENLG